MVNHIYSSSNDTIPSWASLQMQVEYDKLVIKLVIVCPACLQLLICTIMTVIEIFVSRFSPPPDRFICTDQLCYLVAQARCLKRGTQNKEIPQQLYSYNLNSPSLMQQSGPIAILGSGVFSLFIGLLFHCQGVVTWSSSLRLLSVGISISSVVHATIGLLQFMHHSL